jgi:hypothetical protein
VNGAPGFNPQQCSGKTCFARSRKEREEEIDPTGAIRLPKRGVLPTQIVF